MLSLLFAPLLLGMSHALPSAPDSEIVADLQRCPRVDTPDSVHVAVVLKTTIHYRKTRLRDVLASWAKDAEALLVVADAPLKGLPQKAGLVVVRDRRKKPVVPAWKEHDPNVLDVKGRAFPVTPDNELDAFYYSMLVRQLAAIKTLRDCLPLAQAVLIVDDDSFVPRSLLTGALRGRLDPMTPRLMGKPVGSQMFIRQPWQAQYADLQHCGGGSGMLLTRGLLEALDAVGGPSACLSPPLPLAFYSDVNIGVCLHHYTGVKCELPPLPSEEWSCHSHGVPTSLFLHPEQLTRATPEQGENAGFACVRRRSEL